MPNSRYKTLFHGTLVQKTAFSIGGNNPNEMVDSPICRDGNGRFVIRGSGLAGAMIATARGLYKDLDAQISEDTPSKQYTQYTWEKQQKSAGVKDEDFTMLENSIWHFHHSHPINDPELEIRDGVGILQATGAAAEGAKYDLEVIPMGTKWVFSAGS